MLDLRFVVPEMEETFGTIRFAGRIEKVEVRNGRTMEHKANFVALASEKQRKMGVFLPKSVSLSELKFKDVIELVNPRLEYEAGRTEARGEERSQGFAQAMLHADGIKIVNNGGVK